MTPAQADEWLAAFRAQPATERGTCKYGHSAHSLHDGGHCVDEVAAIAAAPRPTGSAQPRDSA